MTRRRQTFEGAPSRAFSELAMAPGTRGKARGAGQRVGQRRRLLGYLQKVDINRYRSLIERLGLRR